MTDTDNTQKTIKELSELRDKLNDKKRDCEFRLGKLKEERDELKQKIYELFGEISDDELKQKYKELEKECQVLLEEAQQILSECSE